MRLPSRRTRHERTGAATVEFALVAPFFFLLILGIFEVGRGLMVRHLLTNAARLGCRAGVIEGTSTAAINAAVAANLKAVGIASELATIQVNGNVADAAGARAGDEITVTVSVPVRSVTWVPGGEYLSGSISGQYTLRRE